ncbi:hypothetical protein AO464_05105 [Oenococcus oeni]|nr:hypothetical protein AO464_05105 [Oenococcus oeni]
MKKKRRIFKFLNIIFLKHKDIFAVNQAMIRRFVNHSLASFDEFMVIAKTVMIIINIKINQKNKLDIPLSLKTL